MSIQDQLLEAMKVAMKAKDSLRLSTIRMARTALKNAEIEARQELDYDAAVKILSTQVKQRREAADAYRATRPELAEKEELELAVLQEFLPAQLSETELEALIVAGGRREWRQFHAGYGCGHEAGHAADHRPCRRQAGQ